jgi:hypothetical protein
MIPWGRLPSPCDARGGVFLPFPAFNLQGRLRELRSDTADGVDHHKRTIGLGVELEQRVLRSRLLPLSADGDRWGWMPSMASGPEQQC